MRWTQPDPVVETGIRKANRFVYGDDDPVDRTDPEGTNTGLDALGAGLGTAGVVCGAGGLITGGAAFAGCAAVATGGAASGIAALADDLFG